MTAVGRRITKKEEKTALVAEIKTVPTCKGRVGKQEM
jgi:hypothetical protein